MTNSLPAQVVPLLEALPICPRSENGFGHHDMRRITTGSPRTHEWLCGKCPTSVEYIELPNGGGWVTTVDAQHHIRNTSLGGAHVDVATGRAHEGAQFA